MDSHTIRTLDWLEIVETGVGGACSSTMMRRSWASTISMRPEHDTPSLDCAAAAIGEIIGAVTHVDPAALSRVLDVVERR